MIEMDEWSWQKKLGKRVQGMARKSGEQWTLQSIFKRGVNADGTSTSAIPGPVTIEEKAQKKNDVKARSMLLMAFPNEHLLTFSQYKDVKTLFEAIQARIDGNDAIKKTQRTLLKQIINKVDTASIQVSIVSTPVSSYDNTANLSDATVFEVAVSFAEHESKKVLPANWECRSLRNQESRPRNQDSSRKTVNVEDTSSKAMVAIDGVGFDWSYMVDDEAPTNMALMAQTWRIEFSKSKFDLATYKRGLASVEEQLIFYNKNEVLFCDQIVVLKRDASFRDSEITAINL
uniref:Uncharacterized protein n=1 Tax=Tanacetum cinerariifolium TaxID=118510 RepID=A0A699I5P2_TANCI|nr:hypothetical protein [Tanacetum cinerariifolium]